MLIKVSHPLYSMFVGQAVSFTKNHWLYYGPITTCNSFFYSKHLSFISRFMQILCVNNNEKYAN